MFLSQTASQTQGILRRCAGLLLLKFLFERGLLFIELNHVMSILYLVNMIARFCCPIDANPVFRERPLENPLIANPSPQTRLPIICGRTETFFNRKRELLKSSNSISGFVNPNQRIVNSWLEPKPPHRERREYLAIAERHSDATCQRIA